MKQVELTLTTRNWWHEIHANQNISELSITKLLGAVKIFMNPNTLPDVTDKLKNGEFEKIVSEFSKITLDGREMFINCVTGPEFSYIKIAYEKVLN